MSCMFSFFRRRRESDASVDEIPQTNTMPDPPRGPTVADMDQIADGLAWLTLGRTTPPPRQDGRALVSGFDPGLLSPSPNTSRPSYGAPTMSGRATTSPASFPSPPGPLPAPPRMPTPQHTNSAPISRTMQHAMTMSDFAPLPIAGPSRRPPLSSISAGRISDPLPGSTLQAGVPIPPVPSTPQRRRPVPTDRAPASAPSQSVSSSAPSPIQVNAPSRARSASSPPSPTISATNRSAGGATSKQCGAVTQLGKRCIRNVAQRAALASRDPDFDEDMDRFCFQHIARMRNTLHLSIEGRGEVRFSDWIPDYLGPNTQGNLRNCMNPKAGFRSDEPGFIYVFEYLDPKDLHHVYLKVGRTTTVNRRIDQWAKQCSSKEPVIRYWHPWPVNEEDRLLVGGRILQGDPGQWCHRLERLVHIEIADLADHAQYLHPDFPNVRIEHEPQKQVKRTPCPDCNRAHREIFKFPRAADEPYKGKEWETLVKPVIEKWARFLDLYMPRD